ncbi:MAG: transposase [Spirosomataceae bacterium]
MHTAGGRQAILTFKGIKTDSKGYAKRQYRRSESICKSCSLREVCCGRVTKYKKLEESIDKPYYDRMHEKLSKHRAYANRISKIRSRTVEPVLGTLINFMNKRRVNTRGMSQANKHVLMAALSYNLQKYLRFERKRVQPVAQVLPIREEVSLYRQKWSKTASITSTRRVLNFQRRLAIPKLPPVRNQL